MTNCCSSLLAAVAQHCHLQVLDLLLDQIIATHAAISLCASRCSHCKARRARHKAGMLPCYKSGPALGATNKIWNKSGTNNRAHRAV